MKFPDARILVFAKAPVAGQVKTRLIPRLGKHRAAKLYQRLVHHTLAMATSHDLCPVELWCHSDSHSDFLSDCSKRYPVTLRIQQGNDLGERMSHAVHTSLQHCRHILLIGTDCPSIQASDLHSIFTQLAQGTDAVIGPARDGGYVFIGLRRHDPTLFSNIEWSTCTVLATTLDRLKRLDWNYLKTGLYQDIDRPEDIDNLDYKFLKNL